MTSFFSIDLCTEVHDNELLVHSKLMDFEVSVDSTVENKSGL